jgi:molecular chaperone DnaJ
MEAYEYLRSRKVRRPMASRQYYRAGFSVRDEVFEEFFGILNRAPMTRSAGPDFRYDLSIPLVAALRGMEKTIEIPRFLACTICNRSGRSAAGRQACPDCEGQGRRPLGPGLLKKTGPTCLRCHGTGELFPEECQACGGLGYLVRRQQVRVKVPPGTENGTRLRFAGQGGEGIFDGPPGDLEVVIFVEPHEFFARKGNDLHCRFLVSFVRAALGGAVMVPTLDGERVLHLPQGTQSGHVFRFKGAGAPGGPQQPPGDQIIEVVVTTPRGLTPMQRRLLEEFSLLESETQSRAAHE